MSREDELEQLLGCYEVITGLEYARFHYLTHHDDERAENMARVLNRIRMVLGKEPLGDVPPGSAPFPLPETGIIPLEKRKGYESIPFAEFIAAVSWRTRESSMWGE